MGMECKAGAESCQCRRRRGSSPPRHRPPERRCRDRRSGSRPLPCRSWSPAPPILQTPRRTAHRPHLHWCHHRRRHTGARFWQCSLSFRMPSIISLTSFCPCQMARAGRKTPLPATPCLSGTDRWLNHARRPRCRPGKRCSSQVTGSRARPQPRALYAHQQGGATSVESARRLPSKAAPCRGSSRGRRPQCTRSPTLANEPPRG